MKIREEYTGHAQGKENTELGRSAEQQQTGIGEQGAEVDHSADADEQQQGEQLGVDTGLKKDVQHVAYAGALKCHRQVAEDSAEAHGQQQSGFHVLGNSQIDQHAADDPHDYHLPFDSQKTLNQTFHQKNLLCVLGSIKKHLCSQSCKGLAN